MHFLKGKKCIFFSRWLLERWNNRVIKQGQISFNQYSTGKYIQHFMTIMCSTWLYKNAKKKQKKPTKQTNKQTKQKKNNRKLLQAQYFKAFFPGVSPSPPRLTGGYQTLRGCITLTSTHPLHSVTCYKPWLFSFQQIGRWLAWKHYSLFSLSCFQSRW